MGVVRRARERECSIIAELLLHSDTPTGLCAVVLEPIQLCVVDRSSTCVANHFDCLNWVHSIINQCNRNLAIRPKQMIALVDDEGLMNGAHTHTHTLSLSLSVFVSLSLSL
jgi:hypothetical protein